MAKDLQLGWRVYIPKWEDNDKDDNPVSLEIKTPNLFDHTKYNADHPDDPIEVTHRIFLENVRNVKNLKIDGVPLTDAKGLWDIGIVELTQEICEAFMKSTKLSSVQKKT